MKQIKLIIVLVILLITSTQTNAQQRPTLKPLGRPNLTRYIDIDRINLENIKEIIFETKPNEYKFIISEEDLGECVFKNKKFNITIVKRSIITNLIVTKFLLRKSENTYISKNFTVHIKMKDKSFYTLKHRYYIFEYIDDYYELVLKKEKL